MFRYIDIWFRYGLDIVKNIIDMINMSNINVLITGGCGFIGSNFINYYCKKNPDIKVINFDALYYCADVNNVNKEPRTGQATSGHNFRSENLKAEKSAKRLPQPSNGSEKEEIHKLLRQYREFENHQKQNTNENENYIGVQDQSLNSV